MAEETSKDLTVQTTDLAVSTENIIVDSKALSDESKMLLKKIIKETSVAKVNDLTELFNINQNKKTIARIDKMNDLLDLLTDQLIDRVSKRPDEMSHKDILDAIKAATDVIDKGNKQVNGGEQQAPLIQINQQDNSIKVDSAVDDLKTRESRERVKTAISAVLQNLDLETLVKNNNAENVVDSEFSEIIEENNNE